MNLNPNRSVRDCAVEVPGATRVFEKLGIDYCCEGDQSLGEACEAGGLIIEEVIRSLEVAKESQEPSEEPDLRDAKFRILIDYIVAKHHFYTKTEIHRLRMLFNNVCAVHGGNHPELTRLRSVFQTLSSELEPHMLKEELVLFPYIVRMEEAERDRHQVSTPPFRTVANPIGMMKLEHEGAGYLLKQLRALTSNYTPPADACSSYQSLYVALEAFEKDLHQHIHLENNILFPRALEMETGVIEIGAAF